EVAQRYADLTYEGRWWSTERLALDALVDVTQRKVTGVVRLKLYKGNATVAGRKSPFALYDEQLASFASGDEYDHADAKGFITLFALPTRAEAKQDGGFAGGTHRGTDTTVTTFDGGATNAASGASHGAELGPVGNGAPANGNGASTLIPASRA